MALKDSMMEMERLLSQVMKDLNKVGRGNKAASQRVRTGTIKLGKIAKMFRKESLVAEKSGKFKKIAKKGIKKGLKKS